MKMWLQESERPGLQPNPGNDSSQHTEAHAQVKGGKENDIYTLLRFCASLVMFGTSILVMLFIPARFIRTVFPTFLPYTTQSQVITDILMFF